MIENEKPIFSLMTLTGILTIRLLRQKIKKKRKRRNVTKLRPRRA